MCVHAVGLEKRSCDLHFQFSSGGRMAEGDEGELTTIKSQFTMCMDNSRRQQSSLYVKEEEGREAKQSI